MSEVPGVETADRGPGGKPERAIAWLLAAAGLVVCAVTAFLFHQLTDPLSRSATFPFTTWFVVFQEAVAFGGLAFLAAGARRSRVAPAVRVARVVVVTLYNFAALGTVVIFNAFLLSQLAAPKTYYSIAIAETGLALALFLIIHVVHFSQVTAHREGEARREGIGKLLQACDRIATTGALNPAFPARSLLALRDSIRFSEALRRDEAMSRRAEAKLDELEALVREGGPPEPGKADRMIEEIGALARQGTS